MKEACVFTSVLILLCSLVLPTWALNSSATSIDVVTPLASKDATVYRFNLRHTLKHVVGLRNVYIVCQITDQMKSIVAQANAHFTKPGQEVILVDESIFPYTFTTIRAFLRENRPTEGFNGEPFDGKVVVPDVCSKSGPKQSTKDWVHVCRQPFQNETVTDSKGTTVYGNRLQEFDRTGWMLQQFLKLGCTPEFIPGIGEAYYVIDADTLFAADYNPVAVQGSAYHYMPGDSRDCANPPYFMTLNALNIGMWKETTTVCAGLAPHRRCKNQQFCPIAHGMVYSQAVLKGLHEHIEKTVVDRSRQPVSWWRGILQAMPAWHTSPFSEYVTYYAFARAHHPDTVVVYGPEQMGASEEEIAPNYYMGNGLGLLKVCRLIEFAASSIQDQAKHMGVNGYCRGGGKQRGACEYYDPKKHGGRACPAPKYESFHGFRNAVPPNIDKAFKTWDAHFLQEHLEDVSRVKVVGDSSSRHAELLTTKEAPSDLELSLKTLDKAISPKK